MKRPNVAKMRRAMERGERDRLVMNPYLILRTKDVQDYGDVERLGREWLERVRKHFPTASATIWQDHSDDTIRAKWREG